MLRFGILGNAKIAREQLCPAILDAGHQVYALATGSTKPTQDWVDLFGVEVIYTDYEQLLHDPNVDAVYIPLPNHLHVDWSIAAMKAGKAVLCEKPIAMNCADLDRLEVACKAFNGTLMEAFMIAYHPQWTLLREVLLPQIGPIQSAHTIFSYQLLDPNNIRAKAALGGGGLLDIGCYAALAGRWCFDTQPEVIAARLTLDKEGGVDRLATALLDYGQGRTYAFTVATQACLHQRISILGSRGWVELNVPFNADNAGTSIRWAVDGGRGEGVHVELAPVNQYTEMVKAFATQLTSGLAWNNLEQSREVISVLDKIKEKAITDVYTSPLLLP